MKIKVIGIGGIGTCLLPPLLCFLSYKKKGVHLILIDGDRFEEKNRDRQTFDEIGNKAEVKTAEYANKFPLVYTEACPEYLTEDNSVRFIEEGDVVFLCVDNHTSRKIASDRCEELQNVTLVSGGNELTDGSVHVYIRRDGVDVTPPLANENHPEIMYPEDQNPADRGCDRQFESAPQLVITNNLTAGWMLAIFFTILEGKLTFDEMYFDCLIGCSRPVNLSTNLISEKGED